MAEAPRSAGEHIELWDGRDDDGKTVKPAAYRFKVAVTPPLNLSYEFTVNNSGDPPWWKQDVWEPRSQPGGWMSDHAPPQGAAAAGDKIFLAAETAEHGHSLIAVDTSGRKLWGAKWLELAGSRCVCSDGKTVYSAGEGSWIGTHLKLFAIDSDTFAVRKINELDFGVGPLAGLGGLSGMAARDGKVYEAFNPPHKEFGPSALDPAALDSENTTSHGLSALQLNALLRAGDTDQPWVNLPLDKAKPAPVRIAWKTPQSIGTILAPQRLEVAALKADAAYPGDLARDADWTPFAADVSSAAMKIYSAPANTQTRALRIRVLSAGAAVASERTATAAGRCCRPSVVVRRTPRSGTGVARVDRARRYQSLCRRSSGGRGLEQRAGAGHHAAEPSQLCDFLSRAGGRFGARRA